MMKNENRLKRPTYSTFTRLPVTEWRQLDSLGEAQVYPRGTEFFQQGMLPSDVYLIEHGLIKLVHVTENGDEVIVGLRSSGWPLGAAALILDAPAPVTAITLIPSRLKRIPDKKFRNLLESDPWLLNFLIWVLCREVYDQTNRLAAMAGYSARIRLEQLLWELAQLQEDSVPQSRQVGIKLVLPLKQSEISQLLGITPTYLSRLFSQMEREGLINRRKGWIVLTDAM